MGFPQVGLFSPNTDGQSVADIARFGFIVTTIVALRDAYKAANPTGYALLHDVSACEVKYSTTVPADDPYNARFCEVSTDWFETQSGTTLSDDINASVLTIPVTKTEEVTAYGNRPLFKVGEVALIVDDESGFGDGEVIGRIATIGANQITVESRGFIRGGAASHSSGARIAALCQTFTDHALMNLTSGCPLADVGAGAETWAGFNVRTTPARLVGWDGAFVDRTDIYESWVIDDYDTDTEEWRTVSCRSIDLDRSNTFIPEVSHAGNYAAFDAAWNAGALAQLAAWRTAVGDSILLGNAAPDAGTYFNGSLFENFPNADTTEAEWRETILGPRYLSLLYSASEMAEGTTLPNLTTIGIGTTSAEDTQLARFGVCTALLVGAWVDCSYRPVGWTWGAKGLWIDEMEVDLGQPVGEIEQRQTADLYSTDAQLITDGNSDGLADGWSISGWEPDTQEIDGGQHLVFADSTGSWVKHDQAAVPGDVVGIRVTMAGTGTGDVRPFIEARSESAALAVAYGIDLVRDGESHVIECQLTMPAGTTKVRLNIEVYGSVDFTIEAIESFAVDTGPWFRSYDHGLVIVNPSDTAATVDLGGTYRTIEGEAAWGITIAAYDGAVLLNPPAPYTPIHFGTHVILRNHADGTEITRLYPASAMTYKESVEAHGFETASIPAYATPAERVAWMGADVEIRTASGPVWFGSVFDPEAASLECAGWNAFLNEHARPTDYVNTQCTDFQTATDKGASSNLSMQTGDGVVTLEFDSDVTVADNEWNYVWWYPRYVALRDKQTSARCKVAWTRSNNTFQLRIRRVLSNGKRSTVMETIPAGSGGTSGTIDVNLYDDASGAYDSGFAFEVVLPAGRLVHDDESVTFTPRIYDVAGEEVAGGTVYHAICPVTPQAVIEDCLNQLTAKELPVASVITEDSLAELDDLLFDPSTYDTARIAEVEKRTAYQALWRPTQNGPRFEFAARPTVPVYYVDATDPGVDASGLTRGGLGDLYDSAMVKGSKHKSTGDVPYVTVVEAPAGHPLAVIDRHRMGQIDLSGYTGATTGITAAFFADQGQVSGTVWSAKYTDLAGNEVRPCDVRCGELVRNNTSEYGVVDVRITGVEHVDDVSATLTVGPRMDFESVLARIIAP